MEAFDPKDVDLKGMVNVVINKNRPDNFDIHDYTVFVLNYPRGGKIVVYDMYFEKVVKSI